MISAPAGPTEPAAGVMVARPAIVPVAIPTSVGLPYLNHSIAIQTSAAVDAERWVTSMACPAAVLAPSADPALNPNQPTHSMAAPNMTKAGLCGGRRSDGNVARLPIISTKTSELTPAVACTTRPPAKSLTPMTASHPPPQTQ